MKRMIEYIPTGVCSRKIIIEIENDIINNLKVIGGCSGNLLGISALCKGMKVDEVIQKLNGIKCGMKHTSCPDQISKALLSIKEGVK
ncbi:MAG: TIGR03905 family TSCPD domain-containing protein [Bacilli bacterium]|nr:TIGR03905 family TSCPD domain-containing protein [Bacilli bacterium]